MNVECLRIADQLERAYGGNAWHGPALRELLDGVTAEQACMRPIEQAHTIWELTRHLDIDLRVVHDAMHGVPMPQSYGTQEDWAAVAECSAQAWQAVHNTLFERAGRLVSAIQQFADARLQDTVPGREYNFYILLHGAVQHSLYHGGQIAVLKKAIQAAR